MSLITNDVDTILRPAMLVRAARCGLPHYRRERDLERVLGHGGTPTPGRALRPLMEMEAEMDAIRRSRTGSYAVADHVEVLVALLAEARIARPYLVSDEGVRL